MSNLQVIANDMLPVLENEQGEKFVNARMLHEKLMTTTKFADWIKRRIRQYGFVENEDFFSLLKNEKRAIGGTTSIDYIFTLDSGKELAMVENTEQGRAIRKYFIEVEKQARKLATEYPKFSYMIEDPVARAKKWIEEQQEKQEALKQLEIQKPKVMFAEAVSDARGTILIRDLAKLIQQNGVDIGEKRLFEWMRQRGYLISRKGTDYNRPTQKSMELGLFKIKETAIIRSSGAQTAITAKVTGKGQLYFVNKFLEQSLKTI
ncbi:phage antirepressor KilAC domain-containing protein [Listeria monocytogenes]|uniref:phage antirepressor KilAC domain-containing protein n=1 Tax=Listeria monocytogenes TaxID=1639 RepID=UPI002B24D242|nr:phage antirepressor KilAC domain-containing protein [Listeria monocytogenes]MEB2462835.1 phage antirepressor KilAC domain-containing protein [Listeria monocytogenes]